MTIERFRLLLAGIIEAEIGFNRERAIIYASGFSSLKEFLAVSKSKLTGPTGVSGKPVLRIKKDQIELLDQLRRKQLNAKQTI